MKKISNIIIGAFILSMVVCGCGMRADVEITGQGTRIEVEPKKAAEEGAAKSQEKPKEQVDFIGETEAEKKSEPVETEAKAVEAVGAEEEADVQEYSPEPEYEEGYLRQQGFWGIWIYATKDVDAAEQKAQELCAAGIAGEVIISSQWSGLNSEAWCCVTAGRYDSEAEAESKLQTIKAMGYSSAYVKYTGDYTP